MNVAKMIKKAKKGNKNALVQLIMHEKDTYYKLAFTYMGNEHDAMDALSVMIITLYEKINQLKDGAVFYSWSKTILVNECKALLRKKQKVITVDSFVKEKSQTNDFQQIDNQIDINAMLEYLNEEQKEAIQLKYFLDYDNKTIAKLTNTSVGTVKSRIFYGLKKLRTIGERDKNGSY